MPEFEYKVREGERITVDTKNKNDKFSLAQELNNKYDEIIYIKKNSSFIDFDFNITHSISNAEILNFTRKLAIFLRNGVSLLKSLSLIKKQTGNKELSKHIKSVHRKVEQGNSLSEGLKSTGIFPDFLVNMVEAGETGGILEKVLFNSVEYLEEKQEFKENLKSSLSYPIMVLLASIGIIMFLGVAVLPQITGVLVNMNVELPLPTKLVLEFQNIFAYWRFFLAFVVLVGGGGYFLYTKTNSIKLMIDSMLLKIPIVNKIVIYTAISQASTTMGMLEEGGVELLTNIEVISKVVNNQKISNILKEGHREVEKGGKLSNVLEDYNNIFPDLFLESIKVGESTGSLDDILLHTGEYYKKETHRRIETLTSYIEPALIIIMAVMIGFIMYAVFKPMLSMINSI